MAETAEKNPSGEAILIANTSAGVKHSFHSHGDAQIQLLEASKRGEHAALITISEPHRAETVFRTSRRVQELVSKHKAEVATYMEFKRILDALEIPIDSAMQERIINAIHRRPNADSAS